MYPSKMGVCALAILILAGTPSITDAFGAPTPSARSATKREGKSNPRKNADDCCVKVDNSVKPVNAQSLRDTSYVLQAVADLGGDTHDQSLTVTKYDGLIVLDLFPEGRLDARVIRIQGKEKILIKAPIDQLPDFKVGDFVMVDRSQIAYADRSKAYILNGTFNYPQVFRARTRFESLLTSPFHAK